jgi:hypothetical protein
MIDVPNSRLPSYVVMTRICGSQPPCQAATMLLCAHCEVQLSSWCLLKECLSFMCVLYKRNTMLTGFHKSTQVAQKH